MLHRFSGPDGHIHLVEALEIQPIAGGDAAIANAISRCVEVESFKPGSNIIEESAPDNDLYFILAGVASIRLFGQGDSGQDGRPAYGRDGAPGSRAAALGVGGGGWRGGSCPHFGVRLRGTGRRQSQAVAECCPRAGGAPCVSATGSCGLRTRVRYCSWGVQPNPCPWGGPSNPLWNTTRLWLWSGPTTPSSHPSPPVESLERALAKADFAALVLSPDDRVISRDTEAPAPRDNLVFELGLCMGALGHSRTFLLHPRGSEIKIPTDLSGFTPLTYRTSPDVPNSVAVASACEDMRVAIQASGPR